MPDHRGDLRQRNGCDPALLEALSTPGFYGGSLPVTAHETRSSWVFLVGELAYRVRKPVGALARSSATRQRTACLQELRVNQPLAADIYLAVKAIVAGAEGYELAPAEAPNAVEYALVMRRYDDADTLTGAIAAGTLTPARIDAVARRLADFHDGASAVAGGSKRELLERWQATIRELDHLEHPERWRLDVLAEFGEAFLNAHVREIERRARDGRVRDGHGDLRCDHVLLSAGEPVTGRIDLDPALRRNDVAADLASLALDLEAHGQAWAARELVAGYRRAGGSPGSEALRAFYGAHTALVRAGLELSSAVEPQPAERAARAQRMWALADLLCWRARRPLVIVVCGPPASGKSTLAAELAERSQLAVVSCEEIRTQHAGLASAEQARPEHYSRQFSRATYDLLSRAALAELHGHGGVIVDATCAARTQRGRLMRRLDLRAVTRLVIHCSVTLDTARARATQRVANRQQCSEGARVEEQFRSFEPLDELPADAVLALDAERSIDDQLTVLTRALDRRLGHARPYSRGLRPWRLAHSQAREAADR